MGRGRASPTLHIYTSFHFNPNHSEESFADLYSIIVSVFVMAGLYINAKFNKSHSRSNLFIPQITRNNCQLEITPLKLREYHCVLMRTNTNL
jgi:hypothetical protein